MLRISTDAARALTAARENADIPKDFGLRIFAEPGENGEGNLALAFRQGPEEGDAVGEQEGLQIFVAKELDEPLDGVVLEIEETPEGQSLVLTMAEETGDPPDGDEPT